MKLKVTWVSNKEQPLSKVGAALYVVTREDIASSGANNLPDLLRLAPGVEVAQINANQWAISICGFNSFYSNKVLAMIDGRALYQPSFSTVLWDMQDLPLEDIERIEVIRGPGGTIWGANAVNGVIHIITERARDTQGGAGMIPGSSAKHHIEGSSVLNLLSNLEWNATLRYVSRLASQDIASYVGADTSLRWQPNEHVEVSVTGQNLLSPRHVKFGDVQKVLLPSPVQRSVFGRLTWRF